MTAGQNQGKNCQPLPSKNKKNICFSTYLFFWPTKGPGRTNVAMTKKSHNVSKTFLKSTQISKTISGAEILFSHPYRKFYSQATITFYQITNHNFRNYQTPLLQPKPMHKSHKMNKIVDFIKHEKKKEITLYNQLK